MCVWQIFSHVVVAVYIFHVYDPTWNQDVILHEEQLRKNDYFDDVYCLNADHFLVPYWKNEDEGSHADYCIRDIFQVF